jgi:hypothetical protein
MNSKQHLMIGFALLALTACLPGTTDPTPDTDSSSASSVEETRNVLYRGTLEELGVSIFMQGTHKLTLDDGRSIILESEDIDLDDYLGESVEVFGSVRPTVEAGGMIMRVEAVTSLASSSSTSSSIFCGGIAAFPCPDDMSCIDDPNDSCDPNNGGADCGGICVNTSSESSAPASAAVSSAHVSSSLSSVAQSSSLGTPAADDDITAKAQIMAKSNMDSSNWTQKYCSTHMSFCMPVHRNWWFNSFGATASALWHLEIGPSEMNNIGEGPITVRLVAGDIASSGMTDGQVLVQADGVVGAKAWTNNRHFEVRAPSNLEAAVRYIIQNIVASES